MLIGEKNELQNNLDIYFWFSEASLAFIDSAGKLNPVTVCSCRYLKCCRGQPSSRIPHGVSRQAQRAIHQLRLNRLSSTASYQALIGQIESPTCPHCGNGDEMAEHLLLLCPKWAVEHQRYFGDSIDIKDVFQDYESLVEFLISSGHLSLHIGSTWRARHDNNNNNNNKFTSQQFFFESAALSKWNWLCSSPVQHCYALPCYTVMWIITGHLCWWAAHVKIM